MFCLSLVNSVNTFAGLGQIAEGSMYDLAMVRGESGHEVGKEAVGSHALMDELERLLCQPQLLDAPVGGSSVLSTSPCCTRRSTS